MDNISSSSVKKTLSAFPVIETDRLRLAVLSHGDAPALQRLTDDPAITAMVHFLGSPFTLADAEALIHHNDGPSDRFVGVFSRSPEDAAELVGVVGVHLRGDAEVEIGYWIASAQHGRGIATEAVRGVLHRLETDWPERRVIAECRRENVASWRLLEKLGFTPTGNAGLRPGRRVLARA